MDLFAARRTPFLARRNYVHEMQHLLAWGIVVGVVEGNFAAVVVAKTFGGGELLINIAATTPIAAYTASLFWGMLCTGRRKIRLVSLCMAGTVLFTGSVGLAPLRPWAGWLFVTQMAAAQFFATGVVTVRSALWRSNYPRPIRGQIVARLQVVRAVMRIAAVALAASLFDVDQGAYRWVYPAVAVSGAAATWLMQRIHVRGEKAELARRRAHVDLPNVRDNLVEPFTLTALLSPGQVISSALRVLRADDRFRKYCSAQMLSDCANLLIRAVVVTVLTQVLLVNMSTEYWMSAVLLEVLPMVLMMASMPRFARYFDRVGVVRFRVIHGVCWTITIVFGLCGTVVVVFADGIGPGYVVLGVAFFALFAVMRGLCFGGGTIAWRLGHLHFARPEDAEVYMGIHVSLTGIRGIFIPTLGMILWAIVGWWVWVVSAVLSVAAIASFAILDRLEQAAADPITGSSRVGDAAV